MRQRGPLVVGVVGAGLILLLLLALIVPKAGQIRTKQREVDDARRRQTSLTVELEQLRAYAAAAPENRRRLQKVHAAVPDVAELQTMIRLVNDAAARADVDFVSVSPGVPTTAPGTEVSAVPVQIMVLGRYFAIDEFLRQLENLPRISKVTTLAMSQGPDGVPQLQVNVSAEFYTTDVSAGPGSQPGHTEAVAAPPAATTSTGTTPGA
ncbi:MAG: type 4a pilus biogenesis protein PilO [Actinomycetota bacterium]